MSLNIKFTIDDSKFLTTEYLRQRQCPGMTEEGTRKYLGFFPQCKAILTISRDEKGNITFKTTDFDDNENDKISQTKFLKICRNECEKYFNYYQKYKLFPTCREDFTLEDYTISRFPLGVIKLEVIENGETIHRIDCPKYAVMGSKTGVILVEGSMEYCQTWVFRNCKHIKKYDIWKDTDGEPVTIVTL